MPRPGSYEALKAEVEAPEPHHRFVQDLARLNQLGTESHYRFFRDVTGPISASMVHGLLSDEWRAYSADPVTMRGQGKEHVSPEFGLRTEFHPTSEGDWAAWGSRQGLRNMRETTSYGVFDLFTATREEAREADSWRGRMAMVPFAIVPRTIFTPVMSPVEDVHAAGYDKDFAAEAIRLATSSREAIEEMALQLARV